MRTTINLPDGLVEAAKAKAAREGRTFTSVLEDGLRRVLTDEPADAAQVELPTFGDPASRPLVDPLDREALGDVLDADGLR
ncbi:MAG TPA: CopG family transcriptional regulator [Acidimicrobiales bacterium]|nr:CopG family transcriptional regulator [Acidimicrobiales bacterium]